MTQERYSEEDIANLFGRTTRTVRTWRQQGIVPPPHRIYREPYWTQEQVDLVASRLAEVSGSLRKSAEVDSES